MKLLYITPSFYPATIYGGPIYSAASACSELAKFDVDVNIYTTDVNQNSRLNAKLSKELCNRDYGLNNVCFFKENITNRFSLSHLVNILYNSRKFDILHTQSIFSLCTPVALFSGFIANKPVVVSPRGSLGSWCIENGSKFKKAWLNLLIAPFSKKVTWHVTAEAEKLEVQTVFPDAQKFMIIPNGIHKYEGKLWSREKLLSELNLPLNSEYILTMGRIEKKKGFDFTINAFRKLANNDGLMLLIAGSDYGCQNELELLIKEYKLEDKVKFLGNVENEKKAALFKHAQLFTLNSRNENFGNVYTEALSFDTPIIASVNTPWQFINETGAGICTQNDADSISEAMIKILQNRDAYSVNCDKVVDNFTWPTIGRKFKEHYQEIINNA